MAKQAHIRKNEVPEGWDVEAADFINKVSIFHFVPNLSINPIVSAKESI